MYGIAGERRLTELEAPWQPGYENARTDGNAAHDQVQLDVYGDILEVFHVVRRYGFNPAEDAWKVARASYAAVGWRSCTSTPPCWNIQSLRNQAQSARR